MLTAVAYLLIAIILVNISQALLKVVHYLFVNPTANSI